jgi:zinc/manganese transport system permease protein
MLGAAGYALGLALAIVSDLPPGPLIVWTIVALAVIVFACGPRTGRNQLFVHGR